MAYLRVKRIGKSSGYFYIMKSVRKGRKVSGVVLEYLGKDPEAKRLAAAVRYWKVGKMKPGKGGR